MSTTNQEPNYSTKLSKELHEAYSELCQQKDVAEPVVLKRGQLKVVGVRSGLKSKLDFARFRTLLGSVLEVHDGFTLIQVVGDSRPSFTAQGTQRALDIVSKHVSDRCVIEYGFTAKQGDANWVVNRYLDSHPDAGPRVIASVVGQTIQVFKNGKWEASKHVKTLVVVYRENGGFSRFGDDTWLSDGVMSPDSGDKLICFDGGLQTFTQAVNVLCRGISVVACTGLRGTAEGFSAASLLLALVEARLADATNAEKVFEEYIMRNKPRDEAQSKALRKEVKRLVAIVGIRLTDLVARG